MIEVSFHVPSLLAGIVLGWVILVVLVGIAELLDN